jgi:hypothetical protein
MPRRAAVGLEMRTTGAGGSCLYDHAELDSSGIVREPAYFSQPVLISVMTLYTPGCGRLTCGRYYIWRNLCWSLVRPDGRLALAGQVGRTDDTGFVAAQLRDPQVSCLAMGATGQPGQVRLPGR